ncbi:MAG: hypothetical protein KF718_22245 [Polyangiaceae bacterium]|nr:hypothetical protein [Polyangiaceae bacterium]
MLARRVQRPWLPLVFGSVVIAVAVAALVRLRPPAEATSGVSAAPGPDAGELARCLQGPRRTALSKAELSPASARPYAACVELGDRLAGALSTTAEPTAGELRHRLARFPFDQTARDIVTSDAWRGAVNELDRSLAQLEAAACGAQSCPPATPPPPGPSPILELVDPDPLAPVRFAARAFDDESALLALALPSATGASLHLVRGRGAGSDLTPVTSKAGITLAGRVTALDVASADRVTVTLSDGTTTRLVPIVLRAGVAELGELPPLPPGGAPLAVGAPLALLPSGEWLTLLRRDASVTLAYADAAGWRRRSPPPGQALVALLGEPPVRVLLASRAATGFLRLAEVRLSAASDPFTDAHSTTVPYVDALTFEPAAEVRCGPVLERFTPLIARGPKDDAFVALSADALYPFRFEPQPASTLRALCGTCPPGVLELSDGAVKLLLPVRRSLAPLGVDTVAAFSATPSSPLVAACSTDRMTLAYATSRGMVVQTTTAESWVFDRVVTVGDPGATPVAALGFGSRILILWLQRSAGVARLYAHAVP